MPRRSYESEPELCERLIEMLREWEEVLARMHEGARRLGAPWTACSTPFVHESGGRLVAHVGVVERSLVVAGREVRLGGIHAVYTRPEQRRRGVYRGLMEEALRHCDEHYPAAILSTAQPELYEPFGFRVVPEHHAVVRAEHPGGGSGLRRLDWRAPGDRALLDRLLRTRAPVSARLGVIREDAVFKFNVALRDVDYCEALDAALVTHRAGDVLHLEDLVAPELPALDELLRGLPEPVHRVVLHFAPDGLGVDAEPRARDDGDWLMVRGEFPDPDPRLPLMLAPTARS